MRYYNFHPQINEPKLFDDDEEKVLEQFANHTTQLHEAEDNFNNIVDALPSDLLNLLPIFHYVFFYEAVENWNKNKNKMFFDCIKARQKDKFETLLTAFSVVENAVYFRGKKSFEITFPNEKPSDYLNRLNIIVELCASEPN